MTTRGSYPKGIARRAAILQAALDVFEREGLSGSSLRTIAKESGLSLTGLLHHFPTREHLLADVLREVDDRAEEAYAQFGTGIDVGEYLAKVMEANSAEPARVVLYISLLAEATSPGHPAAEYFCDRFHRLREVIAELVRHQFPEQCERGTIDADFVASSLVAAADGIQNQWLYDRTIDMGQHIRQTWAMLTGQSGDSPGEADHT